MSIVPKAETLQKQHKNESTMFQTVLTKCTEQILWTNNNTTKTHTIFSIPLFLIAYPGYNMKQCRLYLVKTLERNNYTVKFILPNYLHIDWACKTKNIDILKKYIEMNPDAEIEIKHV